MKVSPLLIVALLFGAACSKEYAGDYSQNQTPETYFVSDTIIRNGENRFQSIIDVSWSGTDADGFVAGYELSFDQVNWTYTEAQDSTITLSLPSNSDTFDFQIFVRAVDNLGEKDPTPASLIYPVKNSNPTVRFIIPSGSPVRSFPAVKYFWEGTDPDGNSSLDHYELIWNDTTQTPLNVSTVFNEAGIVAKSLSGTTSACDVFPGALNTPLATPLNGMILGNENVLYIRAVDQVGAASDWVASPSIFIRKPVSDILFINAQRSSFNRATVQNFYTTRIQAAIGKSFDTLQAGPEGALSSDLSSDPATQDRVFSYFKKIFVYSENSEFLLSLMQRSTTRFFTNGGKLMLITEGNDVIADQPLYLDFSPIGSYTPRGANVSLLMNLGDSIKPVPTAYPSLKNGNTILSGIRPFNLANNNSNFRYEALYKGVITQDSAGIISIWQGNSTLSAKRVRLSDNKTDFVIMLVPIFALEHNASLNTWFEKMLIDELEF